MNLNPYLSLSLFYAYRFRKFKLKLIFKFNIELKCHSSLNLFFMHMGPVYIAHKMATDGVFSTRSDAILWAIYTDLYGSATRGADLESDHFPIDHFSIKRLWWQTHADHWISLTRWRPIGRFLHHRTPSCGRYTLICMVCHQGRWFGKSKVVNTTCGR